MEPATKHYLRPVGRGIKLHLGCGDYWLDGYINIDHGIYGGADMLFFVREGVPFQPEVVERIEAYEFLEHFNKHEVFNMLEDWRRVLINGGMVKISVPNMNGLIEKYATDPKDAIDMIYGYEDNPGHKYGYTKESLQAIFEQHGFKNIAVEEGSLPERQNEPQLILEAEK